MKTGNVHFAADVFIVQFFWQQKSFITEGVFELVAVARFGMGAGDGFENGQGELADSGEVVVNLFLFVLQLFFVGKHLPLASSAYAEMAAEGFYAVVGVGMKANGTALGPVFFVFAEPDVDEVAGNGVFDEDDFAVCAGD